MLDAGDEVAVVGVPAVKDGVKELDVGVVLLDPKFCLVVGLVVVAMGAGGNKAGVDVCLGGMGFDFGELDGLGVFVKYGAPVSGLKVPVWD